MTRLYFKDSEIHETNQWVGEKKKSLSKGSLRIPICFFFNLMNGLNRNWIPIISKRSFLFQLRNCFEEQFGCCREDSSTVEKLVEIDNNYQERLKERLRLPRNLLIEDTSPFSEEERVLIGNRYAVAYRLLEITEQMLPKGKSVLWLCQEFPTVAAPEYPLRIAQLEFGASVLSGYFPVLRKGGGYFEFLAAGDKTSGLNIVQLKNRIDITEDSRERANLFIQSLNAVMDSHHQIVFIHLDEGTTESELNVQTEIVQAMKNLKAKGKEVYFGVENYGKDSPENRLATDLREVLEPCDLK